MRPPPLIIALFLIPLACAQQTFLPSAYFTTSMDGGQTFGPDLTYVQLSTFGGSLPEDGSSTPAAHLVLAVDDSPDGSGLYFGCSQQPVVPRGEGIFPRVLLVSRGGCSVLTKAHNAVEAGHSALIVYDGLAGKYFAANLSRSSSVPVFPVAAACDIDCSVGGGSVTAAEAANLPLAYAGYPGRCGGTAGSTGGQGGDAGPLCALTASPADPVTGSRQICPVPNDFIVMGTSGAAGTQGITIPVVFLNAADGARMLKLMGVGAEKDGIASSASSLLAAAAGDFGALASVIIRLTLRPIRFVDTAGILLWLLGTVTVALASWVSAAEEREKYRARQEEREAVPISVASPTPPLVLSLRQAVYLLLFSCAFLLTLYFLVRIGPFVVVYIITALFSLGALNALTLVIFLPLLDRCAPSLELRTAATLPYVGEIKADRAIAVSVSATLVIVWFILQHASWSFVLQDFFGMTVCCLFLRELRVSSLRTASIAFLAFVAYDIFMVFLTPHIFGSSVMAEVVTAGSTQAVPNQAMFNQACYCRLNPGDTAVCGPEETMPILLRLPHLNDWRGGDSMLGLGDIVIPGLLLSYALRTDYTLLRGPNARAAKGRVGYWLVALVGYFLGLGIRIMAVAQMKMDQPTLLYLVPFTLGPICALAYARGELLALWAGREVEVTTDGIGGIDRGGPGEDGEPDTNPAGRGNESWGLIGVGSGSGSRGRPTQMQVRILGLTRAGRDT
jgi:hypothetical protein